MKSFIRYRSPGILFIAVAWTALLWLFVVPLWQTPDEQSHAAQVAYLSQTGTNPSGGEFDVPKELYISEQILGTERDKVGNNKFTFHPEYKIPYGPGMDGPQEESIRRLAGTTEGKQFIKQEASRYPILYYWPAAGVYYLLQSQNLFVRIFAIRFWSLFLFLLTILFSYRIARIIFPDEPLAAITVPLLVGFQPMMVVANVGVNSDALGNTLFTLFLFVSLDLLFHRPATIRKTLLVILVSLACVYTKPQFYVVLPALLLLALFFFFRSGTNCRWPWVIGVSSGLMAVAVALSLLRVGPFVIVGPLLKRLDVTSIVLYTKDYTVAHTIREVLPWYWGVYKWLGVTYPRWVHRIINRVLVVAIAGCFWWLGMVIKKKIWRYHQTVSVGYMVIVSLLFFLFISLYDWYLSTTSGFSLGVQGRYFFPVIAPSMAMIILGISSLLPTAWRLKEWGIKLLGVSMMALNGYALWTVAASYYDLSTVTVFLHQVSQYKPWFVKGPFFVFVFVMAVATQVLALSWYLRYQPDRNETA